MNEITVDLKCEGDEGEFDAHAGDQITWRNCSADCTIKLHPPSNVSPAFAVDIPPGESTRRYSVNSGSTGKYNYWYDCDCGGGKYVAFSMRTGVINVN